MRHYGGEGGSGPGGGGVGGRFRRLVGDPGNILSWSLPLYRLWGIQVRLHLFFIIFVVAELFRGASAGYFGHSAMAMVGLFGLVLLHEYGHSFACRRVGGDADEILLWPLGGLAYCAPPHDWKANLVTTLGGPAVNFFLLPVFGAGVLILTGSWSHVVFNPFSPFAAQPAGGAVVTWVWWLHYINFLLLAFNMLLPMYPMDAGRTLQNLLWGRIGYRAAQEIAVNTGFFVAVIVGVIGLFAEEFMLIGIAFFAGFTCWMEKQRLKFGSDVYGGEDYSDVGYTAALREQQEAREGPSRAQVKAELKRRKQAEAEQAELDRILDRIAKEGMGSLSRRERSFLQRTSARKRKSG